MLPTTSSSSTRAATSSTTSAETRAALRPTTSGPSSRPSRRGCSPTTMRRAAGPGSRAPSTAARPATPSSTASCAATRTRRLLLLQLRRVQLQATRCPDRTDGSSASTIRSSSRLALFGELGFDVTENFTITAGGRWFDYKRRFVQHQESPEGFSGATLLNADERSNEDGTVFKLNLQYRFGDDHMMYATYSEGFRVGGSNPLKPASILPQIYTSDTLENYELGAKTEWLDNRLRFNVSVYSMDWKDFAVQIEDPQNGGEDENGVRHSRRIPARLRQSAERRDPGPRVRVHLHRQRCVAGRRDDRLQQRRSVRSDDTGRSRTTWAGSSKFRLTRARDCRSRPTGPPRSASNGGRAASS